MTTSAQRAKESRERIERSHKAALEIVRRGACPVCGRALRRNTSLAGWYQCEQSGSERFRKDPRLPPCAFQCFTE